jgi:hypothetical protein
VAVSRWWRGTGPVAPAQSLRLLLAVAVEMRQSGSRRVIPRAGRRLPVHDPAEPVRDDRGSEQETAVRDLVWRFTGLAGGHCQLPPVRGQLARSQSVTISIKTPTRYPPIGSTLDLTT